MDEALLLLTAKRNLRRTYCVYVNGIGGVPNIAGLEAFANGIAQKAQCSPVTITSMGLEGQSPAGEITFPREIWLTAAEELLADPVFLAGGSAQNSPRVVLPDYRFCQPV